LIFQHPEGPSSLPYGERQHQIGRKGRGKKLQKKKREPRLFALHAWLRTPGKGVRHAKAYYQRSCSNVILKKEKKV